MGVAPYPLYTDGTSLYTSFDGGATLLPLGGEAATSHSAAPVSGNGTVGTPFTIANGAIGLPKLATQADQTVLGNVSGGTASPVALTQSQLAALVGGVGWDSIQWARISAILGAQVDNYEWTDFFAPYEYDITGGTNPGIQKSPATGGVITMPHGGSSGTAYLAMSGQSSISSANVSAPIANMKTSAWAYCLRVTIAIPPGGASNMWLGMWAPDSTENECFLGLLGATSTTVLQLVQDKAGTRTITAANATGTIGSGITIGTAFDLMVINDPNAGAVTAYVDGTQVAQSTVLTNQPTTPAVGNVYVVGVVDIILADAMLVAFKRT